MRARPALHLSLSNLAASVWALWLLACSPINGTPPATANEGATRTIYVATNGWHTGIIISRDDLPKDKIPEAMDFPRAAFLEFGWGDREYYPNPRPSSGAALAAALLPTDSVVHLAALPGPPRAVGEIEVVTLSVTETGLHRMIARIDAAFERTGKVRAAPLAPGLSPRSNFYPAHGSFHLFNTCNTWVARKLEAAGVEVSPRGIITADDLMGRLRDAAARDERPAEP